MSLEDASAAEKAIDGFELKSNLKMESPLPVRRYTRPRAGSRGSEPAIRSPLSQGESFNGRNNHQLSTLTGNLRLGPFVDDPTTPTPVSAGKGTELQAVENEKKSQQATAEETGKLLADDVITPDFGAKKKKKKKKKPIQQPVFTDSYQLTGKILGEGAYSMVKECRDMKTGLLCAVKEISKETPDHMAQTVRDQVYQEMELLAECKGQPNIIEFFAFYEEPDVFLMIFEKVDGGELLQHIQDRSYFSEFEASQVTKDIANALSFLHGKGIAHRDLKPQNILCVFRHKASPAKLCDFNLGIRPSTTRECVTPPLYAPVGTPEYMSPEVVDLLHGEDKSYDKRCDVWSLGVILYIMLSGSAPFNGECGYDCGWNEGKHCDRCMELLQDDIADCYIDLSGPEWGSVSGAAKDLIARMLVPQRQRLTSDQVLQHPWLMQQAPETPLDTPAALRRSSAIQFFGTFATEANQINYDSHGDNGNRDKYSNNRPPPTMDENSAAGIKIPARRDRGPQEMVASSFRTVKTMDLTNISTPKFK